MGFGLTFVPSMEFILMFVFKTSLNSRLRQEWILQELAGLMYF